MGHWWVIEPHCPYLVVVLDDLYDVGGVGGQLGGLGALDVLGQLVVDGQLILRHREDQVHALLTDLGRDLAH